MLCVYSCVYLKLTWTMHTSVIRIKIDLFVFVGCCLPACHPACVCVSFSRRHRIWTYTLHTAAFLIFGSIHKRLLLLLFSFFFFFGLLMPPVAQQFFAFSIHIIISLLVQVRVSFFLLVVNTRSCIVYNTCIYILYNQVYYLSYYCMNTMFKM